MIYFGSYAICVSSFKIKESIWRRQTATLVISTSFTPINLPGHRVTYLQSFNSNKYATRKTITQGLVDIALLITNISQLKAVLDAADHQPFFTLLIILLLISILLQVIQGIIYLALGSQFDISDPTNQPVAIILNNMALSLAVVTTVINVIINVFEVHNPKNV